jgi:hypothetical protein
MSDGSLLEQVQQQVADRRHVDWDGVMARLRAENAPPDEVDAFSLLRLLDEVGSAHSSFQSGPDEGEGASAPTLPMPETVLDDTLEAWGRYVLDQKVGRGGFGSVYRAWDPDLHMPVAIKILHRRFSDERLKDRLLQEGRALAQVKHQNVVRVLNVEQHDGRLGLVMEFIAGDTVDALVGAQGVLNEREATVIAEDVCRALIAVHNNGLIHRDVKARNIIRERAGRIVLMDFGAGLPLAAAPEQGRAVGTPLYMAPEILTGRPPSVASDVYSVGVLLFYLVSGRYPYEGENVDAIRQSQAQGRALSLLGLRPDLPVPFVRVVERALAVSPADRYPTPAALLEALVVAGEVRPDWKWRAARVGGALVLLLALFTTGGLLSISAFNVTLGRSDYSTETVPDWFEIGVKSLLMPVVLTVFGVFFVGMVLAGRRMLIQASSRIRAIDASVTRRCGQLASRLSLDDPAVCGCWLLLATSLLAVSVWVAWSALWQVITTTNVMAVPAAGLAVLAPANRDSLTHHRMLLTLLAVANVAGWYALNRVARARGGRLPGWLVAAEIAVLVLLFGSMQIPYRFGRDIPFPIVTWRDARCYVLGERSEDRLLFCPSTTPRRHVVPASEPLLNRQEPGESPFTSFASVP